MDRDAISFMNSSRDPRACVISERIAKVIDWASEIVFHASLGIRSCSRFLTNQAKIVDSLPLYLPTWLTRFR